jgi:hypothetical protein
MKIWSETSAVGRLVLKARVGDAVRNPVPALSRKLSPRPGEIDEARKRADEIDEGLRARGLRIDNTALTVGFVEEEA